MILLSQVRQFGNDFHEWWSHELNSLQNHLRSDKKLLLMVTNVSFYFLHAILYPKLYHKNTYDITNVTDIHF